MKRPEPSKLDRAMADLALRRAVEQEEAEAARSPWFIGYSVALWLGFGVIVGLAFFHRDWTDFVYPLLLAFGAAVFYTFSHRPEMEEIVPSGRSTELMQFVTLSTGLTALVYAVRLFCN